MHSLSDSGHRADWPWLRAQTHEKFNPARIHAFVYDLTSTTPTLSDRLREAIFDPAPPVPSKQVDLLSCIFVLSAIPPERQQSTIANLLQVSPKKREREEQGS